MQDLNASKYPTNSPMIGLGGSGDGPEVSVIIPAYNTEAYIETAIASALNQTLTNLEVVVVDDASTDQTATLAEQIDDPRLRVIRLPYNQGAAVARNRALDAAHGRWVAVLDSDDWYAPERLEVLLKRAIAADVDMIADDLYYVQDGASEPWTTLIRRSGERVDAPRLIEAADYVTSDLPGRSGLHLGFAKPIIKRSLLVTHRIRYDDAIRLGQDFFFYLKCLAHGAKFLLYPQAYYFYRARPGSLVSKSQLERLEQACQGLLAQLETEVVRQNPALTAALEKKLQVCQRNRAYYRVVEPLKQRRFGAALKAAIRHPYFLVHALSPQTFAARAAARDRRPAPAAASSPSLGVPSPSLHQDISPRNP
ncbi:MAG: glycosyltransferase family 2 protein [Synechococcales bacterium]|nr:glycosyltransferase family 2 protein [Synechococcales bacterium]